MSSEILVVGSVAFDVIFSIGHDFRTAIPIENGEIRNFNAVFMANAKNEFEGGTAGNIAYWLGQRGATSTVFSAVGEDYTEKGYRQKLARLNAETRGHVGKYTAHAYMISDPLHQQIIIWQPNDYALNEEQSLREAFSPEELAAFRFAIFSAGTPASILRHLSEFRTFNQSATVIFDPGQITHLFEAADFQLCAANANIVVGNNIEFTYFRKFGLPGNVITIETFGEKGADITENGQIRHIEAIKPQQVVETTGAGDAFRAGILLGLSQNKPLAEAVQIGTELGAECVALPSGQR